MIRRTLAALLLGTLCHAASVESSDLQVRLTTAITSRSRPGTPFRARVIGSVAPTESALPAGTIIHGLVAKALPVGFGIRRERAAVQLEFKACESPAGEPVPCSIALTAVDNAREAVLKNNLIRGVLAAGHPHSWFNGVWYRPATGFTGRAVIGLTGAAGAVQGRLVPNPIGTTVVLATKLLMVRMPEPEIELRAGTDLIVRVSDTDERVRHATPASMAADLAHPGLSSADATVRRADNNPVQDIIHLGFIGTEETIRAAFRAAGWFEAEPRTARAIARTYKAFASLDTYNTAPVSPLFYGGRLPDLVFQKSLNSISKRHHIRLWRVDNLGEPMFLAAATHDIGIRMNWNAMHFRHEVDPRIDLERTKVINDLAEPGCIDSLEKVERPHLAQDETQKAGIVTDGRVYLLRVRHCTAERVESPQGDPLRRRLAAKCVRRIVLETRQYFTRSNIFYLTARVFRSRLSRRTPGNAEQVGTLERAD